MTQEEKDYAEFEKNQLRLIYESKIAGLTKKYEKAIELELQGIEDILEYAPDNIRRAIQERVYRTRNILKGGQ